jgi:hypothetical protein
MNELLIQNNPEYENVGGILVPRGSWNFRRNEWPLQIVIPANAFCYRNHGGKAKSDYMPGSKMKCNTLKCELEKRTQKGVADETVSTIKLGRKREDGSAKAIGVLYSGDCLSVRENAQHGLS